LKFCEIGRSQKDGLPSCRGGNAFRFKAIDSRLEGQPGRCPFLIGNGNGRQDAGPCFARRPVALLHRRSLVLGLRYFGFGLFCARWSRRSRPSREAVALTAATQKGKAPPLRGDGAEVMPHCSACGRDSEGQRRTFRAKAIRDRANWFRLPEQINPAARPLGVSTLLAAGSLLERNMPPWWPSSPR